MVGRLFVMLVVAAAAVNAASDNLELAESDELIEAINKAQTTWTARRNFPVGTTREKVRRLLDLNMRVGKSILPMKEDEEGDNSIEIPGTFDARVQWPMCTTIKEIKDQSDCASGWAVAAAAILTDRICISTGGNVSASCSARDLMACCPNCGPVGGCLGGRTDRAWQFIQTHGIVTGGDYGSK